MNYVYSINPTSKLDEVYVTAEWGRKRAAPAQLEAVTVSLWPLPAVPPAEKVLFKKKKKKEYVPLSGKSFL